MLSDEWVFIVQHSKSLHFQIVEYDTRKRSPRWVRLLKKLSPLKSVIVNLLIPYLL